MFITAVCVLFLIKLRWPNNKSLYDTITENKQNPLKLDGVHLLATVRVSMSTFFPPKQVKETLRPSTGF